jgi:DNA (cytosine-5)-methyltransferase 1
VKSDSPVAAKRPRFNIATAEFFAGIGLVREALSPLGANVVWANDIEIDKLKTYAANHDATHFRLDDVRNVGGADLPDGLELATSSFPCVDLSLAGNRKGLDGLQSGMFWEFARVLRERSERPKVVMLENVRGFASSRGGKDLRAAVNELNQLGYSCDVFTIDARHFVPQSRPRMFIVGVNGDLPHGAHIGLPPLSDVRPEWIRGIFRRNADLEMHYVSMPDLPKVSTSLDLVVERLRPSDRRWWDNKQVAAFLESLSALQSRRLDALVDGPKTWRTAYRRTRHGRAVWEIRRDDISGCLRTTGGGSSRQVVVEAGHGNVRIRWMTAREYASLMGACDYVLLGMTENKARFGFGDAVVVDVVRWIGEHYLIPTLRPKRRGSRAA